MTEHEHESRDVVDVLRKRLGVRYRASIDDGRAEIARVLASELNMSAGDADTMTSELIDSGRIRYVTAVERDVDYDVEAQRDERGDRDSRAGLGLTDPDLTAASDNPRANAVAGQGGPQTTAAGLHAGAAAPVAAGTSSAIPGTLPIAATDDTLDGDGGRGGYWDFGGGVGVVPSTTRKGQVEPRGT